MNIGLDLDAVLCDNHSTWDAYYHLQRCGRTHDPAVLADETNWYRYRDACSICYQHVLHDPLILEAHLLRPGALGAAKLLASHFSCFLLTSRPADTEAATWRWLKRAGVIEYLEDVLMTPDKAAVCRRLGVVFHVDDAPAQLLAIGQTGTVPLIWDQPYNRHLPGPRAENWGDVLGIIYGAFGRMLVAEDTRTLEQHQRWLQQADIAQA